MSWNMKMATRQLGRFSTAAVPNSFACDNRPKKFNAMNHFSRFPEMAAQQLTSTRPRRRRPCSRCSRCPRPRSSQPRPCRTPSPCPFPESTIPLCPTGAAFGSPDCKPDFKSKLIKFTPVNYSFTRCGLRQSIFTN